MVRTIYNQSTDHNEKWKGQPVTDFPRITAPHKIVKLLQFYVGTDHCNALTVFCRTYIGGVLVATVFSRFICGARRTVGGGVGGLHMLETLRCATWLIHNAMAVNGNNLPVPSRAVCG